MKKKNYCIMVVYVNDCFSLRPNGKTMIKLQHMAKNLLLS